MRFLLLTVLIMAIVSMITVGCASKTDTGIETHKTPASAYDVDTSSHDKKEPSGKKSSVIGDTGGEIQYLGPEDMKKLREERKEAIERNSPFNEEVDEVQKLQEQYGY